MRGIFGRSICFSHFFSTAKASMAPRWRPTEFAPEAANFSRYLFKTVLIAVESISVIWKPPRIGSTCLTIELFRVLT